MRKLLHVPVLVVCLVLASGSLMAQRTAESRSMVLADTTIYANDRFTGGLYILRYTGSVSMD